MGASDLNAKSPYWFRKCYYRGISSTLEEWFTGIATEIAFPVEIGINLTRGKQMG